VIELTAMGWKFMLSRFLIGIPGIAVIACVTEKLLTKEEKNLIYESLFEKTNYHAKKQAIITMPN